MLVIYYHISNNTDNGKSNTSNNTNNYSSNDNDSSNNYNNISLPPGLASTVLDVPG